MLRKQPGFQDAIVLENEGIHVTAFRVYGTAGSTLMPTTIARTRKCSGVWIRCSTANLKVRVVTVGSFRTSTCRG